MLSELKKISNQLTLLRLLIIPLMYVFAYDNNKQVFAVLFVLAGFTDVLDGFLARRLKQASNFGNNFDSMADRMFYFSLIPWFYWLENEFILSNLNIIMIFIVLSLALQILNVFFGKYFRHTYLAKFSAVLTYALLLWSVFYGLNTIIMYIIISITILSNIYELIK